MKSFAVQGGFVVKGPRDVVRDQYVVVEGNTIREIVPKLPEGITEVLGGPDDIVMPGLVNTHTHAAMTLFRGYADDLPLMTWLQDYIFPAEARFVDREFVYLGTLLAAWEMTRSGTTAFCDGYFFEDQVGRAAREVGIRAWLGEGILQFPHLAPGPSHHRPLPEVHRPVAGRPPGEAHCISPRRIHLHARAPGAGICPRRGIRPGVPDPLKRDGL